MKRPVVLSLDGVRYSPMPRGITARSTAISIRQKHIPAVTVAAEVMDPGQVRNEFSTTLVPTYQVLEVAIYPQRVRQWI